MNPKNTITQLKNSLESFSGRLDKAEKESVNLKIVIGNYPVRGAKKEKSGKLKVLWNNSNRINICTLWESQKEKEERERRGSESLFFKKLNLELETTNLGKEMDIQTQKV